MRTTRSRKREIVQCEVVRVACPPFLVNSLRRICLYEAGAGAPLAPGYYLALWPVGACCSVYGREVGYLGPCGTAVVAHLLRISALALGIVRAETDCEGAAAMRPIS